MAEEATQGPPSRPTNVAELLSNLGEQQMRLMETYKGFLQSMHLESNLCATKDKLTTMKQAGAKLISLQKEHMCKMLLMLYPVFRVVMPASHFEEDKCVHILGDKSRLETYDLVELSCLLRCYFAKLAIYVYHLATFVSDKGAYERAVSEDTVLKSARDDAARAAAKEVPQTFDTSPPTGEMNIVQPVYNHKYVEQYGYNKVPMWHPNEGTPYSQYQHVQDTANMHAYHNAYQMNHYQMPTPPPQVFHDNAMANAYMRSNSFPKSMTEDSRAYTTPPQYLHKGQTAEYSPNGSVGFDGNTGYTGQLDGYYDQRDEAYFEASSDATIGSTSQGPQWYSDSDDGQPGEVVNQLGDMAIHANFPEQPFHEGPALKDLVLPEVTVQPKIEPETVPKVDKNKDVVVAPSDDTPMEWTKTANGAQHSYPDQPLKEPTIHLPKQTTQLHHSPPAYQPVKPVVPIRSMTTGKLHGANVGRAQSSQEYHKYVIKLPGDPGYSGNTQKYEKYDPLDSDRLVRSGGFCCNLTCGRPRNDKHKAMLHTEEQYHPSFYTHRNEICRNVDVKDTKDNKTKMKYIFYSMPINGYRTDDQNTMYPQYGNEASEEHQGEDPATHDAGDDVDHENKGTLDNANEQQGIHSLRSQGSFNNTDDITGLQQGTNTTTDTANHLHVDHSVAQPEMNDADPQPSVEGDCTFRMGEGAVNLQQNKASTDANVPISIQLSHLDTLVKESVESSSRNTTGRSRKLSEIYKSQGHYDYYNELMEGYDGTNRDQDGELYEDEVDMKNASIPVASIMTPPQAASMDTYEEKTGEGTNDMNTFMEENTTWIGSPHDATTGMVDSQRSEQSVFSLEVPLSPPLEDEDVILSSSRIIIPQIDMKKLSFR